MPEVPHGLREAAFPTPMAPAALGADSASCLSDLFADGLMPFLEQRELFHGPSLEFGVLSTQQATHCLDIITSTVYAYEAQRPREGTYINKQRQTVVSIGTVLLRTKTGTD